jgi:biopolymer transport protein TolQ
MNPAEVAQSALPVSADLSILGLFLQAHWVVKLVMIGLLICSIWVWAIAIDKTLLFNRTRRAMDRFEQAFWSSPRCGNGSAASRDRRAPSPACRCASTR